MKKENKLDIVKWLIASSGKYLWFVVLLTLNSMLISLCFIEIALLSKQILDFATGDKNGSILMTSVCLFGMIIFQALCNIVSSNCRIRALGRIENNLKQKLFLKVLHKEYSEITKLHTGELMNRFTSDVEFVATGLITFIPQVAALFTKISTGLIVLYFMDRGFTFVVLSIGILIIIASRIYSYKFRYLHKKIQNASGLVRSFMQECLENVIVVKSFSNEKVIEEQLKLKQEEYYKARIKQNTISNLASTSIYVMMSVGYYLALSYGAIQISRGALTFGTLMAFLQILDQIKAPFRNISGLLPRYDNMIVSAQRLRELELFGDEAKKTMNLATDELYNNLKSIDFINCSFVYDNKIILNKVNLKIKKGSIIGIVGESGQGKTTLFHLLLGLYRVTDGGIFCQLKDSKAAIDASTRALFAYVPQGNLILSGSIKDNLLFANPKADDSQLQEVIKICCLDEFLNSLPEGIDTKIKERGLGLSQGQNQRIAIARALLSTAPILLLDECTSSLDIETERRLLANLKNYHQKTVLCISHRQEAIRVCDELIKVEQGQVCFVK